MRRRRRRSAGAAKASSLINLRAIAGNIAALVASGLMLFAELWTVVPAPTLPTLTLAVIIPELTPWCVAGCLATALIAQFAAVGWARTVASSAAALALGLALVPWCLLPATIADCERQMQAGLGAVADQTPSAEQPARLPMQPYQVSTALFGYPPAPTPDVRANLPVITRDGVRLGLDLYTPPGGGVHPAVVVIYGGAWIFGQRANSAWTAIELTRLGYTAIAIDYRHAPAAIFPTQPHDVDDALATIARNSARWHVDPHRVALLGLSAGAQLALLAAYAPEPLTIRAVVAYYAPTDLVGGYRYPPRPDPTDVDRILRTYLGGTPDSQPQAYTLGSPLAHVRPGLPATLLVNGSRDELVRVAFARHMREALRRHANRVVALDLPWSNHAFDSIKNGTGGQIARYYTARFLAATL